MTTMVLVLGLIIVLVGGVSYLIRYAQEIDRINKKIKWAEKRHYTLLKILVPKNNSKSPLAAEQMFTALHGIYRKTEIMQDHFSFEMAATSQSINFYVLVPTQLRDFIEGQIYSQYPTVEISAVSDYSNVPLEGKSMAGTELTLTKSDFYPIRTFTNFDVDPLAGITGVLSKVDEGELLAIQGVFTPIDDSWQKTGLEYVKNTKEGKSTSGLPPFHVEMRKQGGNLLKTLAKEIVTGIFTNPAPADAKKEEKKEVRLSGPEELALKGIEAKVTKLGFTVTLRILSVTSNPDLAHTRVDSVVGAFKQFNLNNLNSFDAATVATDSEFLRRFRSRNPSDKEFRLNVEEIASVFHFPDLSVETPNIVWAGSKKGEPPQNLPLETDVSAGELTTFGLANFRNRNVKFGMKAIDRRLHFYIIGKTGTGKSTLIENMIYDDIMEGRGVAVVDPHGELIDHILNFIPDNRVDDVVYFNPDDREQPLAFNLLESVEGDMRTIVASGLMSIFTKLWANVWSARMEYILRNAILAVLEVPDATLLGIMRVLNDTAYRRYVLSYVTDPVVRDFFINEYEKYDAKFRQEAIAPIQNKVGQFLSSTTIRNIVGQSKSTFDLAEVMDSGKILLVDLSIGKIGEDNSKLLGSMMITKIQLAAMGRAKVSAEERRDFYLYVDEFQNFATDSFAVILSEARKYRLNLVLANQYIAQIPEVVADAIFGNVGTTVSFRVGATDAEKLVKEFAPTFDANDLVNLPNRQIYVKMAIDGVTSQAFSAHTLPPRGVVSNNAEQVVERSRGRYGRNRQQVEAQVSAAALDEFKSPKEQDYEKLRDQPYIIGGTLYKEFSAKGGDRWYFGQPDEVMQEYLAGDTDDKGDKDEKSKEENLTDKPEEKPFINQQVDKSAEPRPEVEVTLPQPQPEAIREPRVDEEKGSQAAPETVVEPPSDVLAPATTATEIVSASQPNTELICGDALEQDIVPYEGKKKRKRKRKKRGSGGGGSEYIPELGEPIRESQDDHEQPIPSPQPERVESSPLFEDRGVGETSPTREEELSQDLAQPEPVQPDFHDMTPLPPIEEAGTETREPARSFAPAPTINRGHQHDDWLPIDELP